MALYKMKVPDNVKSIVKSRDRVYPRGLITIVLTDLDGNVEEVHKVENVISTSARRRWKERGAGFAMKMTSGNPYKKECSYDTDGIALSNANGYVYKFQNQDYIDSLFLLNLSDALTINADTHFMPILSDTTGLVDTNKVIGYGNSISVSADTRVGQPVGSLPDYMIDNDSTDEQWFFADTKANGTFNFVGKMPNFINHPYRAYSTYKCIVNSDLFISGNTMGGQFLIPGVKYGDVVITNDNEVLMSYTNGGQNRWKYNLVTGITTQVLSSDPAYAFPLTYTGVKCTGQLVVGNFVFIVSDTVCYVYNITTQALAASINVSQYGGYCGGLYYDGTSVIAQCYYDSNEGSQNAYARVTTINPSTLAYTTTNNVNYTGWANLPDGWATDRNRIFVNKINGIYYVSHMTLGTIMCTDIMNVKTTIVGVRNYDEMLYGISYYNSKVYLIRTGAPVSYTYQVYSGATTYDFNHDRLGSNPGVWVNEEDYANWTSMKKLAAPITKTSAQLMYIAYSWKFSSKAD